MRLPTSSEVLETLTIVGIVVLLGGWMLMVASNADCKRAGYEAGVEVVWKFPGHCEVK